MGESFEDAALVLDDVAEQLPARAHDVELVGVGLERGGVRVEMDREEGRKGP